MVMPPISFASFETPAPRYWGDHLHYRGPTQVNFSQPKPFVAAPVEYETPRFLPYVPKYKSNYVNVDAPVVENSFGSLFEPYDFYQMPTEEVYGDPIYDPKNDKLHGKPPKKEHEEDIHAHHSDHEEDHHDDHHDDHHSDHHADHHDDLADEG